jgi:hypothetical protein
LQKTPQPIFDSLLLWRLSVYSPRTSCLLSTSGANNITKSLFNLANCEALFDDLTREARNLVGILETEQDFRVAHREMPFLKEFSHRLRQLQKSQHVRDRSPILPDRFSDLLLSQTKLPRQLMISFSFFDRIKVSPLKVFDECQGEDRFVVDLLDDGRYLFPAKLCGRTQATLTGDELESVLTGPAANGYRLQKSARLKTLLQLAKILRIERLPRLKRVPTDLRDWDGFQRAVIARGESSGASQ